MIMCFFSRARKISSAKPIAMYMSELSSLLTVVIISQYATRGIIVFFRLEMSLQESLFDLA